MQSHGSALAADLADGAPVRRGSLTLIDASGVEGNEYKRIGKSTLIPRSTPFGGVENGKTPFGDGVTFRETDENWNPISVKEHFLPGQQGPAAAAPSTVPPGQFTHDVFGQPQYSQQQQHLQQQLDQALSPQQDSVLFHGAVPQQQPAPQPQNNSPQSSAEIQELRRVIVDMSHNMQRVQEQLRQGMGARPEPEAAPAEPQIEGITASFAGNWGKLSARYADYVATDKIVVLIQPVNAVDTYEPPVDPEQRFELTLRSRDGEMSFTALNLGLSFSFRDDNLLILPIYNKED